jgi:hypothetical protein
MTPSRETLDFNSTVPTTIPLDTWLHSPEYRTQRDSYFNVKLACGHAPADPTGIIWGKCAMPSTTGYGQDPKTGKKFCYDCCAEHDIARARKTGRGFFYLNQRNEVTTWPGNRVSEGAARIMNQWRDNFGGTRVAFRFRFNGEVWSGTGPGSGMYCRVKRTKLKSLGSR